MPIEHEAPLPVCEEKFNQFEKHIEQGEKWRQAIIGIVFAIILQVITFAALWGRMAATVEFVKEQVGVVSSKIDRHIEVSVR